MNDTIDTNSLTLLENITKGLDFSIPNIDFDDPAFTIPGSLADALQKVPDPLTLDTLTECTIDGNGAFDKVMTALKAHLTEEYEKNRITGAEYAKVYTAMMQYALQYAVQYLLGKDNAYYQALGTQAQALTANIDAYTAKVKLAIAQAQAHLNKAQYANEVIKLGVMDKQTDHVIAQTATQEQQTILLGSQKELVDAQTITQEHQQKLLTEQTEQAHAQVSDTRLDGSPVSGYTGNQNKLLQQQTQAFKNDAVIKGSKVFADSFATQLSMGSATVAGTGLDSTGIQKAITNLQTVIDNNS